MKRMITAIIAAVALLAPMIPAASASASTAATCTRSGYMGSCAYPGFAGITGNTQAPAVGNDVWSPVKGTKQTLTATSPANWSVTATVPSGHGGSVVSYPNVGATYGLSTPPYYTNPLSSFKSIQSGFSEQMDESSTTEAAYDIWGGQDNNPNDNWNYEVMIQNDFTPSRNRCPSFQASATFAGQEWQLCTFGTELIWQLPTNEQTGTVHILAMLKWLISNGYLPKNYGLEAASYGWEICSTNDQPMTFTMSNFWLHAKQ